ncbi:hypothetical protein [Pseudonocardia sp. ICBG1034]|uniref:hypothetical protein n=1 Tax=Pseudonocardia sp. ICBG1034 TaxID=2844381 RepID=UPI001CCED371|nr:hypothetical protein [Pseudonocardia sp. ICBG1034]
MSLTSQLQHSSLARWCAAHLPGTRAVVDEIRAAATTATVARPPGRIGAGHWPAVGGIVSARLAALVQDAAPYAALYGLVGAELVSAQASNAIAAGYPAQEAVLAQEPELAEAAVGLRPSPSDVVALLAPPADGAGPRPGDVVFTELAHRGHSFARRHAPTGVIGTAGVEAALARTHAVWTLGEDRYRSGITPPPLARIAQVGGATVEQLRALALPEVVEDAAAIARVVESSGTLADWRGWAGDPSRGQPLGFASPVLVPHWAEADLLVGDTLVEVKTVLRADQPARIARWVWQLLGYAWLDTGDRWKARHLAFYLARHGVTLRWPLAELETLLVGDPSRVAQVRDEFRRLAEHAAVHEGATLLPTP